MADDIKPVEIPINPPVEEPPPVPKRKITVQLKGGLGPLIEIEEGATTVQLPIAEFAAIAPEVWRNTTDSMIEIVNDGKMLAFTTARNRPFGGLPLASRWAWADGGLIIEHLQDE